MTPKQSVSQPLSELHLKVRGVALWIAGLKGQAPAVTKAAMDTLLLAADALAEPAVHLPDLGIAQGHVAVPASEEKRDAERMRWIAKMSSWDGYAYWTPDLCIRERAPDDTSEAYLSPPTLEEFRAVIDAAMNPAESPSKPGQGAGGSGQDES